MTSCLPLTKLSFKYNYKRVSTTFVEKGLFDSRNLARSIGNSVKYYLLVIAVVVNKIKSGDLLRGRVLPFPYSI